MACGVVLHQQIFNLKKKEKTLKKVCLLSSSSSNSSSSSSNIFFSVFTHMEEDKVQFKGRGEKEGERPFLTCGEADRSWNAMSCCSSSSSPCLHRQNFDSTKSKFEVMFRVEQISV